MDGLGGQSTHGWREGRWTGGLSSEWSQGCRCRLYPVGRAGHTPGHAPWPEAWGCPEGKGKLVVPPAGGFLASPSPFPTTALPQLQFLSLQTVPPPKAAARNSALKAASKRWHILGPETQTPEEAAAACSHRTEREAEARTGRGVLWHWNPAV